MPPLFYRPVPTLAAGRVLLRQSALPDHDGYHLQWGVAIQMHRTVEFLKNYPPDMPIGRDMPLPAGATNMNAVPADGPRQHPDILANRNAKRKCALHELSIQEYVSATS